MSRGTSDGGFRRGGSGHQRAQGRGAVLNGQVGHGELVASISGRGRGCGAFGGARAGVGVTACATVGFERSGGLPAPSAASRIAAGRGGFGGSWGGEELCGRRRGRRVPFLPVEIGRVVQSGRVCVVDGGWVSTPGEGG